VTIKNSDNPGISGSQPTAEAPALDRGRKAARSSPSTDKTDLVSVDAHQAVIARLLDPNASTNASKIAELQRLYASGQYSVDALGVSRALITSALNGE
jgi:anti-sigma28 factor (negative regulator of flagellin synthesis)